MTTPTDPTTRQILLEALKTLRVQQDAIQEYIHRIYVLEKALLTNLSFAPVLEEETEKADTPEQRQAHAAALAHIDDLIQALLKPPTVH
jgi:hypothetical protein